MSLFCYSYMINILVAGMIIAKIVFTCVAPSMHHPAYSWVTWALAVACSALIVWILQGHLRLVELAQTIINALFCIALFSADGDVAFLIKGKRHKSIV
ncbi:phage holin family protein [Pseudescherichia vulneris]|uniref:phage holin family protein n=1 Tax=Pseudescherichia vulneris TaxID=566 RepID=UPI00227ACED5|nr:phage holin family protein [Pseudescherichia vulneris]WAH53119.1 phage holin family protein [Pseudescherichia vulneris]